MGRQFFMGMTNRADEKIAFGLLRAALSTLSGLQQPLHRTPTDEDLALEEEGVKRVEAIADILYEGLTGNKKWG